jgi:hypothetical protein
MKQIYRATLARWPTELSTGEDVEMEVRHRLTGVGPDVRDDAEAAPTVPRVLGQLRGDDREAAGERGVF